MSKIYPAPSVKNTRVYEVKSERRLSAIVLFYDEVSRGQVLLAADFPEKLTSGPE
jgi:hypothetical protein